MRASVCSKRLAVSVAVAGLACLAAAACDDGPSPSGAERPAEPSRDEVERLRALGYAEVASEPVVPGRSGVVVHDRARSYPGYNLFTNAHFCSSELMDADGEVVRRWHLEPCFRWDNSTLLADGSLLVVGRQLPRRRREEGWNAGRFVARLAFDGTLAWQVDMPAHHDVQPAPDGRVSVLTSKRRMVPAVDPGRRLRDDELTLLSAAGERLESASLYDLLVTAPPEQFRFRLGKLGKGPRDELHANSIFWMDDDALAARDRLYARGNVVVTVRHQDTVAVIDWAARKTVWAWGQGELSGPHDAVVLPSGNFLVFDNGLGRSWSRVVELDPHARRIVWQYRAPDPPTFYSRTRGGSQRLPNGNTLIAQSDAGRAFEVTPQGDVVWEFLNPNLSDGKRGALVRMRRLESAQVQGWIAGDRAP